MKLFSNFDTTLGEVQFAKAIEEYGVDKTIFIRRDKIYLYIKVYHKIFWGFVLLISCVGAGYYSQSSFGIGTGWIVGLVLSVSVWFIAAKKRIDWWMDYTIITPRQVIQYDQTGLLDRSTRTLDLAKIKSINIKKNGLLTSVFDLGDIVFFSEGDDLNGDIRLNYIKKPIALKTTITKIMHHAISSKESYEQETGMINLELE